MGRKTLDTDSLPFDSYSKKGLREMLRKAYLHANHDFPFGRSHDKRAEEKTFAILTRLIQNGILPGKRLLSVGGGGLKHEAVFAFLGYEVTVLDDLSDAWHVIGRNRDRLRKYAESHSIQLIEHRCPAPRGVIPEEHYHAVLAMDVIEHLHESPRTFLNQCIEYLVPGGLLVITTPNAVHSGKRLRILFGCNPYGSIGRFYWNIGPWRGYVREYTCNELKYILETQGLEKVRVDTINILSKWRWRKSGLLLQAGLLIHTVASALAPGLRDTLIGTGVRPSEWNPKAPSGKMLRIFNPMVEEMNLDHLTDDDLLDSIMKSGKL